MQQGDRTPLTPVATFGRPVVAAELAKLGDAEAIVSAITGEMATLMRSAGFLSGSG
jgi:hypothetical protein